MIRLLRLRRLVQVAVLLLLAALPWLNRDGFTGMKGSLFAFDFFGLPFADPLGAVQIGLSGIIPGWRLIAGALVVLAVALCLGRIFCSWFCPFGFLSELVHAIRGRRPPKPLKHGFRSRAVIALVGLALVPLLGFPLLNQLSLPGGLSLGFLTAAAPLSSKTIHTVLEHLLFFAVPFLPVITVLAVELVTGERLWCRWVCPQSVLLALMARLPVAPRLRRTLSRCTCKGEPACRRACSLGLDPRNPRSASPLECTNCGACREACPRKLIVEVPYSKKVFVNCSNKDKGPAVTKVCANSCIGCGLCQRTCKFDAIHVVNNVAVIDYTKCKGCTMCAKACPRNAIEPIPTPEEKEKFKAAQKAAAEKKAAAAKAAAEKDAAQKAE
mgnify:CR=1 FL=1